MAEKLAELETKMLPGSLVRSDALYQEILMGGDKPYEKLQRALKADVDEAAWMALYSTKSRLFDQPETGKITVKVINHYGDEVLKVFGVG